MSLIDEYLLEKEENRRVRLPQTLYVTDLTRPCLKETFLDITHDRPHPVETLRIFNAGRVLEDYWVDLLDQRKDIAVLATQLRARYAFKITDTALKPRYEPAEYDIHGRVDILCQHDKDGVVVHEVKTAKTTYWMKEPKPEHVDQLQFYLNVLGVRHGQIDYLDKTVFLQGRDPRRPDEPVQIDKSFPVKTEQRPFYDIVMRAHLIAVCLETGEPPEANPDAWGGRVCDYCLYRDLCEKEVEK